MWTANEAQSISAVKPNGRRASESLSIVERELQENTADRESHLYIFMVDETPKSNVINMLEFLAKKKQKEFDDLPRHKYGVCELCGKVDRRKNGACYACTEYWGLD
jgi:RNA polymerase-binding transcription factor DksA